MTLDDIIGDRYVAGVKIDVEGAERLVVAGAERALAEQRIGLVQLEWSDLKVSRSRGLDRDPIADFLRDAGYRLYRPDSTGELHLWQGAVEISRRDVFAASEGFRSARASNRDHG